MPRSQAWRGEVMATGRPSSSIVPAVAGVMPKMVSATSVRPEPTRPAMPRISPRRSSKETSRKRSPKARPGTLRMVSPIEGSGLGKRWSISRPTIIATRVCSVTSAIGAGADQRAVAQHGHAVGELEDLRELVADVDDADAAVAQALDHDHQAADVGVGERRGRLVHDEDAGVLGERLGDLDPLAVGDGEGADLGVDVEVVAVEASRGAGATRRRICVQSRRPRPRVGAWPRKTFSATVSSGKSSSSW